MKKIICAFALLPCLANAELVQQFKDPTFSGQGWASQVLTVEQMRQTAAAQLKSKADAEKAASDAAAAERIHRRGTDGSWL